MYMYMCLRVIIWFGCHHCIIMCSTTTLLPYLLRCSRCMHWLSIYTVWSMKPSLLTCTYWQLLPTIVHYSIACTCVKIMFQSSCSPVETTVLSTISLPSPFSSIYLSLLLPSSPPPPSNSQPNLCISHSLSRFLWQWRGISNRPMRDYRYRYTCTYMYAVYTKQTCTCSVHNAHGKHTCIKIVLFMFSSCLSLSHSLLTTSFSLLLSPSSSSSSVHFTTGNMPAVEDPTGVYVSSQGAAGLVWRCTCLSVPVWGGPDDVSTGC